MPRGRPRKIKTAEELKEEKKDKRSRPRKGFVQKEIHEEDYVFPVFSVDKNSLEHSWVGPGADKNTETLLSPHILDLRQPIKYKVPEKLESTEKPTIFNYPSFNPDNWFSNFNLPAKTSASQKVDFELPEQTEAPIKKIEYHKPVRAKIRSAVKINFGEDFVQTDKLPIKVAPVWGKALLPWAITKKFFKLIGQIIAFPFKLLDFTIDRTLKAIWWLVKFIVLALVNLIKAIFLLLKIILTTPRPKGDITAFIPAARETPAVRPVSRLCLVKYRFNYKPILSFALICLIIVLPLQILNWQQQTSHLKGQVLGQSRQAFDDLKKALILGQDFDFEQAGQQFEQAYFNFKLAHNYLDNLDIFSRQLIKLVPEAKEVDNLLIIGQLAAQLGQGIADLAQELQAVSEAGDNEVKIMKKVQIIGEALNQMEPYFLELLTRLNKIDTQSLAKYVTDKDLEKITLFQSSLPALKQNFGELKNLNNFLADFLGQEKSQKYLIIFQNNSELRPTGGFMGSYALMEIKKGKIVQLEVPGGGFYDLKTATQTMVEAPKPFQLFSPYWQIWNANWFPDWPSSAQKIAWFYEQSLTGVTLDGVLALTPDVIEDLLAITGSIEMPVYQKTITAENFTREVQLATELEYDKEENQPKKIIADLMPQILERVFNLKMEQSPAFLEMLSRNLARKNILAWFKDDSMQRLVHDFSWSGEIKASQRDYLMVIHTNVGGGKTDRVIKNKIQHQVEIEENGDVFATVMLTRKHEGQANDIFEGQNNVDYVRFYLPEGSRLIEADGFDYVPYNLFKVATNQKDLKPDSDLEHLEKNPLLDEKFNMRITQEFGKTCFGSWLMVKPGEEKIVKIKYQLPFKIQRPEKNLWQKIINFVRPSPEAGMDYNLMVQKQPGLHETDFESQLYLPSTWQVINSQAKDKLSVENNTIIYQDNLETDGYYRVEMR